MKLARVLVAFACLGTVALFAPSAAEAETAVVNGISKLFVRRGAGLEFPPFASLSEGSVVEIKAVEGEWAQIVTANGQVGYVQRRYLETGRGETARATLTPTRRATRTRSPRPTRTPTVMRPSATPTAVRATRTPTELPPTERSADSTPTVSVADTATPTTAPAVADGEEVRDESPAATVVGTPGSYDGAIHHELRQLRVAVERLQRRLDEISGAPSGAIPMVEPVEESSSISGGTVLLTLIGIAIGWALGAAYARNQERGRRSRIRF